MTLAICINCGTEKIGALTLCHRCGFNPATPEDQAKGLMLSSHNLSPDQLRSVAERIQGGEPATFNEASVEELARDIRANPTRTVPLGCRIAVWVPSVIMLVLAILVGWLLICNR